MAMENSPALSDFMPPLNIYRLPTYTVKSLLSALLGTRASRESSRPHSVGPSNADEILNMNNPRPRAARTSKLEELSGDHGNLGKSKVMVFCYQYCPDLL